MTISVDHLSFSTKVASGATVATLTLTDSGGTARKANWILTPSSAGFFAISGAAIVTLRAGIPPGNYAIVVCGSAQFVVLEDQAAFVLTVTA